jgi:hypothetical protein
VILAVLDGDLEKVKSILNNPGIDVNQEMKFENGKKGSLLLWAIQNGNYEISKMLINDYKVDVNCNVDLDGKLSSILIAAMAVCFQK